MATPTGKRNAEDVRDLAERLRRLLSRWVRTTREQAGTPSTAQLETLRLLKDEGPATIAALARKRAVKHQSMRLLVEQLAAEKAVGKEADPHDRRSQLVSITGEGRRRIRQDQAKRTGSIAERLGSRTPEEKQQVMQAIETLERLLEPAPNSSGGQS